MKGIIKYGDLPLVSSDYAGTDESTIVDEALTMVIGGNMVKQNVLLRKGLSQEIAKKLSKLVRDNLKKVTPSIQGDKLRITAKSKDDLQLAINLIRNENPIHYRIID